MTQKEIFSYNLKRIMEAKGEKQVDLAKHLGVSTATVCEWIKGKKLPKIDKIGAMVLHYGCNYVDLLGEGMTDEDEDTLVIFYRALTDEDKEKALSYLAFLLGEESKARHNEKRAPK